MEKVKPKFKIDPQYVMEIYEKACSNFNTEPIEYLEFVEKLCISLSMSLAEGIVSGTPGIATYPVDNNLKIWCLLIPCKDAVIRIIFGPEKSIREVLDDVDKSINSEKLEEMNVSSISQF